MKTARPQRSSPRAPPGELAELRARVADAEETLHAIRNGEVDAVVVAGKEGPQVFTLQGADYVYRVLMESMHEGALVLTQDGVILYANQSFAGMIKRPLEHVLGSPFPRCLSGAGQAALRPLLKQTATSGFKIQALLHAEDGSQLPVSISMHPLEKKGGKTAAIGVVLTDMTESRRHEEVLRAFSRRLTQVQEAERRLVALELHDAITQHLCAILARWAALANKLPAGEKTLRREVTELSKMLGRTVEEVQRIARNLRPSVLDELGLVPALRAACTQFADRTNVSFRLTCKSLTARLPADTELVLYRIVQKALENVEKYARARHVTVHVTQQGGIVHLTIKDDGIGFDPDRSPAKRTQRSDFGLLRMRERATGVGGAFIVKSAPRAGTKIEVRIPLPPPGATAAKLSDL